MGTQVIGSDSRYRVVALLSGDADLDEPVTRGLRLLGAEVTATADPAVARESATKAELWLVDVANPSADLSHLMRHASPGRILALLPADRPIEAELTSWEHYLVRPFQARTLAALCQHLLAESGSLAALPSERETEPPESPRVVARAPSLFKSRVLYTDACRYVERVLDDVRRGRKPPLDESRILAERIHTSLLQSNRLLLMALEPYERFELPAHCANVALLAGKIAMGLGWGLDAVLRAIRAGLLHDIGMGRLPERLLLKEGKLTDEEWELVHQHPGYGAEIVTAFGESYEWLRTAVLQEHERMNGQGYPAGLSAAQIDSLARVIAVADVFEAFSHPRTYRSLFTTYEALEQVVGLRDETLSSDVVATLVDEISAFPLDSFVLLSNGEIGRVVGTNPTNLMRPIVQTVWDPLWQPLTEPRTVDLSAETTLSVTRPLHETELPIT